MSFYLCWDLCYTLKKFLSLSSSLYEDMNLIFSNAFKIDEFNLLLCNFALLLLSQISSYSLLFVVAIIRKFNKNPLTNNS